MVGKNGPSGDHAKRRLDEFLERRAAPSEAKGKDAKPSPDDAPKKTRAAKPAKGKD